MRALLFTILLICSFKNSFCQTNNDANIAQLHHEINGLKSVNTSFKSELKNLETDFSNRYAVVNDSSNQPYLVLQKKFYLAQLQYTVTASPLVVLTACETAAGQLQTGEGIVSLGRAFISKGVKGVVASRWKVDDAVAPVFVKTFYEQLNSIHSPAAALMHARKKYLQSTTSLSQKNPLLWAGFSYMGVEQQIELKKATRVSWYWWLLIPIIIIIILQKRKV